MNKLKQSVRIIGGHWRSRRVCFPQQLNIKPTPDRVRETLFNWLSPVIEGSYCLDLFSGSGALGFEALSRGAHWVGLVENSYETACALHEQIRQFHAADCTYVYCQSYHRITQTQLEMKMPHKKLIDIIFIDPPFKKGMIETTLSWLNTQSFLSSNAYCYIEYERGLSLPQQLQSIWRPIKQQHAGQVNYGLWQKAELSSPSASIEGTVALT